MSIHKYVFRRVTLFLPTLFVVSLIVFSLTRVLPGDAVDLILEDSAYVRPEDREALRDKLGLSDPLPVQYVQWAGDFATGDFGASLWSGRTIREEIGNRLPVSAELAVLALVLSLAIALPVGVIAAVMQDTWIDHVVRTAGIFTLSVPNFVLGTLALTYLSIWFNWIPPIGYSRLLDDPWRNFQQFLLPAIILGAAMAGSVSRMTRSSILGVLRQDYIRTAWAKGLPGSTVLRRHALRNALNPVITISGIQVGNLLGGTLITETLFAMPGVGRLLFDGILQRDYPIIQGVVMLSAIIFLTVNLIVDLLYRVVDPRIQSFSSY